MSANTVPKMFRGVRWLQNSNYRENDIRWKPIEALYPKSVKRSGYKAWTVEQSETREKTVGHIFRKSIGKAMICEEVLGIDGKKMEVSLISKLLRHSKPSITIDHYLKADLKQVKNNY